MAKGTSMRKLIENRVEELDKLIQEKSAEIAAANREKQTLIALLTSVPVDRRTKEAKQQQAE